MTEHSNTFLRKRIGDGGEGANENRNKENVKEKLKRPLAPYVRVMRKSQKAAAANEHDRDYSFYLQKKPSTLLQELSAFLTDSVDLPSLLQETSEVLKNVTKASGVTLFMVDDDSNDIIITRRTLEMRKRWKIEEGTIVAAFVANKKEYVMVDDVNRDERFPGGVGYTLGPRNFNKNTRSSTSSSQNVVFSQIEINSLRTCCYS